MIVRFLVAFSGFANDTAWFLFGALLLGVVLVEPYTPEAERERKDVQAAANAIGQQLIVVEVGSDRDFETAFATFALARGGRAVRRDRCVLELLAAIVWPRRARDEVSGCYTKFTSIAA